MLDDLAQKEEQLKVEAQNALIKHVFDNLRNLLICISLTVGGLAVFKYRAAFGLGSTINTIISGLIVLTALGLFLWNMFHGIRKFSRPVSGTKKALCMLPFALLYMFASITVFQALFQLQTDMQLRTQTTEAAPNITVKRAAPQAARPAP